MDFRIIKKFCLNKASKLLLHQKQWYQTELVTIETLRIRCREYN